MFTFQRILSAGTTWTDNLFFQKEHIGVIGSDKDGAYLKLKRTLTIGELNLLISQITVANPELMKAKIEMLKWEEVTFYDVSSGDYE